MHTDLFNVSLYPDAISHRPVVPASIWQVIQKRAGQMAHWLVGESSHSDCLVVTKEYDDGPDGSIWIYDRVSRQHYHFTSEENARIWIERQHYPGLV